MTRRAKGPAWSKSSSRCRCRNHLGSPKQQHRSRAAAVQWAVRSSRVRGMRLEPYRCPTSNRWHIRTAREARP